MTFHDIPWPSMTFHDLPWHSISYYDMLSRPGLMSGPLQSSPAQINSHLTPRLVPIDSKSSVMTYVHFNSSVESGFIQLFFQFQMQSGATPEWRRLWTSFWSEQIRLLQTSSVAEKWLEETSETFLKTNPVIHRKLEKILFVNSSFCTYTYTPDTTIPPVNFTPHEKMYSWKLSENYPN